MDSKITAKKRAGVVLRKGDLSYDWLGKNAELGLNVLGLHAVYTGDPISDIENMGIALLTKGSFIEEANSAGMEVEYELHIVSSLLPRELFKLHPEFFRVDEEGNRTAKFNYCQSNPEANRIVKENIERISKLFAPQTNRYFFWGDDGKPWCMCEECREFSDAENELRFSNLAAEAIKEIDPDGVVAFLSYLETLSVPQKVEPAPNVFLEFAPMRRDYSCPINDPNSETNRKHWDTLHSLLEIFPADTTHILEYWLDAGMFSDWKRPYAKIPFPPEVIQKDIEAYSALGVNSITTFGTGIDKEYVDKFGDDLLDEYGKAIAGFFRGVKSNG